jgi:Xaa-Pro aminopeptidase
MPDAVALLPAMPIGGIGTAMMPDRDRVDFTSLRAARRERVLAAMAEAGLDALILGREPNVRYACGARRLWVGSSRPWAPSCVLMRDTGRVHLMAFGGSADERPDDIDPEDVFCVSYDPGRLLKRVAGVPGLAAARRVGVDGFSLHMRDAMQSIVPNAEFVGFEPRLRSLRRRKLPEELAAIRIAVAIAESGLSAAVARLAPGASEKELQAAFLARVCEVGTSEVAQHGTFTEIGPHGELRWVTSDRRCRAGSLVALSAGVLWAGYEGTIARTWWCGHQPDPSDAQHGLYQRWRHAIDSVVVRCRPGATGADLEAAYRDSGEELPDRPIVYSVGMGHEGPVTAHGGGPGDETLEAGMVLAVRAFIPSPSGGFLGEEMVHVGADRTEWLTTLGHGPLAG